MAAFDGRGWGQQICRNDPFAPTLQETRAENGAFEFWDARVLPQNKCRSRGTIAPGGHGRRMPIIHGSREFTTASDGWSACADHDVVQQMRPQQRFDYFATSPDLSQSLRRSLCRAASGQRGRELGDSLVYQS